MIDKNSNEILSSPLDTIIDFALSAGAGKFWVNNAKDELNRLRNSVSKENSDYYYRIGAWARVNDKGQPFDLRLQKNPYLNPDSIIPMYIKIDKC